MFESRARERLFFGKQHSTAAVAQHSSLLLPTPCASDVVVDFIFVREGLDVRFALKGEHRPPYNTTGTAAPAPVFHVVCIPVRVMLRTAHRAPKNFCSHTIIKTSLNIWRTPHTHHTHTHVSVDISHVNVRSIFPDTFSVCFPRSSCSGRGVLKFN